MYDEGLILLSSLGCKLDLLLQQSSVNICCIRKKCRSRQLQRLLTLVPIVSSHPYSAHNSCGNDRPRHEILASLGLGTGCFNFTCILLSWMVSDPSVLFS